MDDLQTLITEYLDYCTLQKRMDAKTLKAYRIDLRQFSEHFSSMNVFDITTCELENYIAQLHQKYKPKTVKRKNALRDAAVIELLFATGIRISELCSLKMKDVNLYDRTILIYGKGSKERKV